MHVDFLHLLLTVCRCLYLPANLWAFHRCARNAALFCTAVCAYVILASLINSLNTSSLQPKRKNVGWEKRLGKLASSLVRARKISKSMPAVLLHTLSRQTWPEKARFAAAVLFQSALLFRRLQSRLCLERCAEKLVANCNGTDRNRAKLLPQPASTVLGFLEAAIAGIKIGNSSFLVHSHRLVCRCTTNQNFRTMTTPPVC